MRPWCPAIQRLDRLFPRHTQYQNYKLIYRRYAGLYFSMGVDVTDNELAYLESIHLFVELLDEFFRNVCELDIVFNFNKVGLCSWLPSAPVGRRPDPTTQTPTHTAPGLLHPGRVHFGGGDPGDVQAGDFGAHPGHGPVREDVGEVIKAISALCT